MSSVNGPITRAETLQRAQNWVDRRIPYSQGTWASDPDNCRTYRQDCSGYVSMAWHLGSSLVTGTLPGVCTEIAKTSVQPGDALWRLGHIVLVATAPSNGSLAIYEEPKPEFVALRRNATLGEFTKGYRYNNITDGGTTPPHNGGDDMALTAPEWEMLTRATAAAELVSWMVNQMRPQLTSAEDHARNTHAVVDQLNWGVMSPEVGVRAMTAQILANTSPKNASTSQAEIAEGK